MKAQVKVLESFQLLGLNATSKFKEEKGTPEDESDNPLVKILRGEVI